MAIHPVNSRLDGNRGDNVRHTYDEANAKWNSAYDIFWKDKHTPIDVYGYYPYGKPESISDYEFNVQRDQSKPTEDGEMGGYEQSDFLWGKATDVAPTTRVIRLPLAHRMSLRARHPRRGHRLCQWRVGLYHKNSAAEQPCQKSDH